jgi:hypothetical protein
MALVPTQSIAGLLFVVGFLLLLGGIGGTVGSLVFRQQASYKSKLDKMLTIFKKRTDMAEHLARVNAVVTLYHEGIGTMR